VTNRSEPNLIKSLLKIMSLYKVRDFAPSTALMNLEFEYLRLDLLSGGVNLNTTATSEHVFFGRAGVRRESVHFKPGQFERRSSNSKMTKYINVRYFFIRD
jgi:hypothetical protein